MTTHPLHVIVQAGGRGSRLRHHTWNKPKCLVSVRGKPLLYHLFDRFPGAHFWIIGDYAFDQLEKYLHMSPPPSAYTLVRATAKGTTSAIAPTLAKIPPTSPVVVAWSDLIINALPAWPAGDKPVLCTTSAFTCRWRVAEDGLRESPSTAGGIPGIFYFPRASLFPPPPDGGEFVHWYADTIHNYTTLDCPDLEELGDFDRLESSNDRDGFSRFFNKVEISGKIVTKIALDSAYSHLIGKEQAWYREATKLGFRRIPKILSEEPYTLERIIGQHAYQMHDLTERERRAVLADYLDALTALHDKASVPAVPSEVEEVYLTKTLARVKSVAEVIPGFDKDSVTVNGKKCRNLFAAKYNGTLEALLPHLQPTHFVPIHGDATFSNTLVDDKLRVWFIDPRGYFAKPGIMGDAAYDFAKVYYSAVGGYDTFNRRKFKLHVDDGTVEVLFETPAFATTAHSIFAEYFLPAEMAKIEILHGLIWLALSGYAKDDLDSVIGSFYLGLYWLEMGITALQAASQ